MYDVVDHTFIELWANMAVKIERLYMDIGFTTY